MVVRVSEGDHRFVLVPGDREIAWPKLRALLGVNRLSMPSAEAAGGDRLRPGHHHAPGQHHSPARHRRREPRGNDLPRRRRPRRGPHCRRRRARRRAPRHRRRRHRAGAGAPCLN
nr:YbaK/EbsC family protein [Nocardioides ungokensis]